MDTLDWRATRDQSFSSSLDSAVFGSLRGQSSGALGYANTDNMGDDEIPATAGDVQVR